jgi:hypothetical protein
VYNKKFKEIRQCSGLICITFRWIGDMKMCKPSKGIAPSPNAALAAVCESDPSNIKKTVTTAPVSIADGMSSSIDQEQAQEEQQAAGDQEQKNDDKSPMSQTSINQEEVKVC